MLNACLAFLLHDHALKISFALPHNPFTPLLFLQITILAH